MKRLKAPWRSALCYLLCPVGLLVLSSGCGARLHRERLVTPNPTAYTFPFPFQEVHEKALLAFSSEAQSESPDSPTRRPLFASTLYLEPVVDHSGMVAGATTPYDFTLRGVHEPLVRSKVYYGPDGGLPFFASFHVRLANTGSNTLVSVKAFDTEVINGTGFGWGPCGPGRGNKYKKVKPTTMEEYMVLRHLGRYLGVTNMPPLVSPTVPRKQI